jgi:serine/threonine-protein kinase
LIGLRVNNYEVVSLLGEGGMGAVYLAEHALMGRKAAIKLLRHELTEDRALVARFINEARAANAIRHPNIIDVLDVGTLTGQHAGQPYMMMEFLEGESLGSRLAKRGTLPSAEAVEIARQATGALGAAHAKSIVHRDLKPDNLFLVPDDRQAGRELVKVLDFGIAKLRGDLATTSVKTRAGSILGTPPYMSPEQCRGLQEEVDRRTDVYALGIILYEMLTGAPPFMSAGVGDVLVMHLTQAPLPPRRKRPDIPEWLERVILRALAKTPDERFATMEDLAAALDGDRVDTVKGVGPTAVLPRVAAPTPPGPTLRAGSVSLAAATLPVPGTAAARTGPAAQASTTFSRNTGEALPAAQEGLLPGVARPRALRVGALGLGVVAGGLGLAAVAFLSRGGRQEPAGNQGPPPSAPVSGGSNGPAAAPAPPSATPKSAPAIAPPVSPSSEPRGSGLGTSSPTSVAEGVSPVGIGDAAAPSPGARRGPRRLAQSRAAALSAAPSMGAAPSRSGAPAPSVSSGAPPNAAPPVAPAASPRPESPAADRSTAPAIKAGRAKRSAEKW